VKADWRDGDSGRQRKYYALTALGKRRLANETKQWEALSRAMAAMGILPEGAGA
jgi:PadR family transcriptional regulator, regulatory protein PadR